MRDLLTHRTGLARNELAVTEVQMDFNGAGWATLKKVPTPSEALAGR